MQPSGSLRVWWSVPLRRQCPRHPEPPTPCCSCTLGPLSVFQNQQPRLTARLVQSHSTGSVRGLWRACESKTNFFAIEHKVVLAVITIFGLGTQSLANWASEDSSGSFMLTPAHTRTEKTAMRYRSNRWELGVPESQRAFPVLGIELFPRDHEDRGLLTSRA